MSLTFRAIVEADAALLLAWRTDPEISKYMLTDLSQSTIETQKQWIASLCTRDDYQAFMVLDDGNPIGFLSFSDIDSINRRCSPGLYIYDKKAGLKYAITIHYYISYYVFCRLNCNKMIIQVLSFNEKAQKMNLLNHVRFVGCLRQHIFKNNSFHDVYVYEVLREEWQLQRPVFTAEHMEQSFIIHY